MRMVNGCVADDDAWATARRASVCVRTTAPAALCSVAATTISRGLALPDGRSLSYTSTNTASVSLLAKLRLVVADHGNARCRASSAEGPPSVGHRANVAPARTS